MARVKICPVCQSENGPTATFCSRPMAGGLCGAPLARVRPTDTVASLDGPAAAPAGGCSSAAARQPAPSTVRETPAPTPVLVFPWGKVSINDRLAVGSDPTFSPLATQLAANPFVSGRHAELFTAAGALRVRHIGRTNPTYVNGRPLESGETAEVADGDMLGFSKELCVQVLIR